jgi:hypothetical protein
VDLGQAAALRQGKRLKAPADGDGRYRLLDTRGRLVAIGRRAEEDLGGVIAPEKVFSEADETD